MRTGENALDGVIETLSAMLHIEFENTKQKEGRKEGFDIGIKYQVYMYKDSPFINT